ncbi:MAG: (Fe-S)-binding protein [Syntrophobacteraceae bacterium]|nr:(Fe-S)-binding protein [Syntrophobacteraceae bacterium]
MNIGESINLYKTYYCLDCGVCTGSCPVSRVLPTFSPRLIVEKALLQMGDELLSDRDLWSCLTCGRCYQRCPTKIDFPEFMRNLREEAIKRGLAPALAHHGMLQSVMEFQAEGVRQKKTDWAREAGKIADRGEVFYFVGCMPYFDVIFRDIGVDSLSIGRSVIKILNAAGVTPVVSDQEACCGHDMLWNGNPETFKKLAAKNIELIRGSGAKKVVFSCPEGYYTFQHHYPQYFGELGFEVVHFFDYVQQMIADGALKLSDGAGTYTFHDPCRLGRMAKIYDSPRAILGSLAGEGFREMERNRENAVCCGTTGWANCSSGSKQIQAERIREARATGARTLVTACPKCRIHLSCALTSMEEMDLEVKDLTTLISESMR